MKDLRAIIEKAIMAQMALESVGKFGPVQPDRAGITRDMLGVDSIDEFLAEVSKGMGVRHQLLSMTQSGCRKSIDSTL